MIILYLFWLLTTRWGVSFSKEATISLTGTLTVRIMTYLVFFLDGDRKIERAESVELLLLMLNKIQEAVFSAIKPAHPKEETPLPLNIPKLHLRSGETLFSVSVTLVIY